MDCGELDKNTNRSALAGSSSLPGWGWGYANFKSRMKSRRRGLRRRRRTISKLEVILCAFLAENNFVNALILFSGLRTLRSRRRANEDSALIWNWNYFNCRGELKRMTGGGQSGLTLAG